MYSYVILHKDEYIALTQNFPHVGYARFLDGYFENLIGKDVCKSDYKAIKRKYGNIWNLFLKKYNELYLYNQKFFKKIWPELTKYAKKLGPDAPEPDNPDPFFWNAWIAYQDFQKKNPEKIAYQRYKK